jgi:chemotaxis protein CheX
MNAEVANEVLRSSIASITHTVFETMLRVPITAASSGRKCFEAPLTAAVYYAGSWKGALVVECSTEQASRWASRLMSLTPPILADDVRDGLGELTNMIAGNVKPLLASGLGISIPSVVEGNNHKLRIVGACQSEALDFEDEGGPFRITLLKVLE